jgi:YVTN family beta-propeller protein
LVAAAAIALALIVAGGGLLVWRPRQPQALASVSEDSIGVIDRGRGEVIGQIRVGTRPGGIAVGEGSAWATNTGSDTVSQIDLGTRSAVNRIPVGHAPTGIVVAGGSVWVTNSGERSVSRISAATGRSVATIEVGNGPTAIVASGTEQDFDKIRATWDVGATQVTVNGWAPDFVAASNFLGMYTCRGEPTKVMNHCDGEFDAAFEQARGLQVIDPAAAAASWAALDRQAVDLALMAPLVNAGGDFVSARVGNYQFSPTGVVLFDQMWVK